MADTPDIFPTPRGLPAAAMAWVNEVESRLRNTQSTQRTLVLRQRLDSLNVAATSSSVADEKEAREEAVAAVDAALTAAQAEIEAAQLELDQLRDDLDAADVTLGELADDIATLNDEVAGISKNLFVEPNAPTPGDGAGKPVGALWYQEVAGSIAAAWTWDGASWVPTTVSDAVLGEIDAGKIATGYLDADRIAARSIGGDKIVANSIGADELAANSVTAEKVVAGSIGADKLAANSVTAEKVVITDGANLFQSTYLLTGNGPVGLSSATPYSGSLVAPTGGRLIQLNARDHFANYRVPAKPGEEFYAEVVAKRIAGTAALNPLIAAFTASGGTPTGMAGVWNTTIVRGTVMEDLGDGWVRVSAICKVPEAATDAALVGAFMQVEHFAPYTSQWIITDVVLRRRASGNLIVDGAITADKLAANAIDGKTITGATVRTSASGQRVELTSANHLRLVAPNGTSQYIQAFNSPYTALGSLVKITPMATGGGASVDIGPTPTPSGGWDIGISAPYGDFSWASVDGQRIEHTARGKVSYSSTIAAGSGVTLTITFPSGRFASAPNVVVTPGGSSRLQAAVVSISATSCSVRLDNFTSGNAIPDGIQWIAVGL